MTTEALIEEIRTFVGIEELTFDQEGICALRLQDQFLLLLKWVNEQQQLVMVVELPTPKPLPKELLTAALTFNCQRMTGAGISIALDPNAKVLFLVDEFSVEILEPKKLRNRLEQFFKQYLTCQGIFSEAIVEVSSTRDLNGVIEAHEFA